MKKWMMMLLIVLLMFSNALAEDKTWTLMTEEGTYLTRICYEPSVGDTYISAKNTQYEVIKITGEKAVLREMGTVSMPDVSWLDADTALPVISLGQDRRIALYCTHSDESYEPSDGLYSDPKRGSIYEIAHLLADALNEDGIQADVADETHHPHDAGAYRRSRQTAVQLLKGMPDAIFDVHRDGIPDPDEYAVAIGGRKASKIRLLVGRGNQNMEVNKAFALQIKAIADKVYPGLIKDIYMGKGTYNQDLAPKSLLFECGTYTLEKERVAASMPMLANVVSRALYGGVVGSAGRSDTTDNAPRDDRMTQGEPDPEPAEEPSGSGAGIIWLVGLAVAGLVIFGFATTGSGRGAANKIGRNISEMTGGLLGKKPPKE